MSFVVEAFNIVAHMFHFCFDQILCFHGCRVWGMCPSEQLPHDSFLFLFCLSQSADFSLLTFAIACSCHLGITQMMKLLLLVLACLAALAVAEPVVIAPAPPAPIVGGPEAPVAPPAPVADAKPAEPVAPASPAVPAAPEAPVAPSAPSAPAAEDNPTAKPDYKGGTLPCFPPLSTRAARAALGCHRIF